jgi:hypothetical protein
METVFFLATPQSMLGLLIQHDCGDYDWLAFIHNVSVSRLASRDGQLEISMGRFSDEPP